MASHQHTTCSNHNHHRHSLGSGISSSSQSTPPSYALSVHDHILPHGWSCKYDPRTNHYYFLPYEWRDESLFYKLKGNFPNVDSYIIRFLLAKHNNVEHEAIAAIVSYQCTRGTRYQSSNRLGSPKMKLRYLKLMYPEAEENFLFDLLYNCEHNAQDAIQRLEKMGYQRKAVVDLLAQDVLDGLSIKSKRPTSLLLGAKKTDHFPPNVSDKDKSIRHLMELYPQVDSVLITYALESCDFNEEQAGKLLAAMTPQDSGDYLQRLLPSPESLEVMKPSCGTQTNALVDYEIGTPVWVLPLINPDVCDVSTWTKEDGVIQKKIKIPLAKGCDASLKNGPQNFDKKYQLIQRKGADASNKRGTDAKMRHGPNAELCIKIKAKGPETSLRKGANSLLRLVKKLPSDDE